MFWKYLSVFAGAFVIAAGAAAAPRINFPESSFNAGTVWEGEKVPHTFSFSNIGDSPLEITRVKTSCGCTAAKGNKDSLAPGEEGTIRVEFNTNRRSGAQSKQIYVQSNDPENSLFKLTISCYVNTVANFTPRALFFNNVIRGDAPEETLTMEVVDGPFRITGVEGTGEFFEIFLPEENKEIGADGGSVQLRVRLLPTASLGKHSGEVILTTDHPQLPRITARVRADIRGLVEYVPRMCFFNRDDLTQKRGKIIQITKRGPADLEVSDPQVTIKGFSLKLEEIHPGQEYTISIVPSGVPVEGRQRGFVYFSTNQPDQAKIEIPISSYMPAP